MRNQTPDSTSTEHRCYRLLLHLYPKAHRQEYGELMMQTLDDILRDQETASQRLGVWFRVAKELPSNLTEEHLRNLENILMRNVVANLGKRKALLLIIISAITIGAVFAVAINIMRPQQFTPTTLSNISKSSEKSACLQTQENTALAVPDNDASSIANASTLSIIDVPAGTNVDVYIKTYSSTKATGTAIYSGKYGSYNFEAGKASKGDAYTNGWQITQFNACK